MEASGLPGQPEVLRGEERLRGELADALAELEACKRERDDLLRRHLRLKAKYRALKYRPHPPGPSASYVTPPRFPSSSSSSLLPFSPVASASTSTSSTPSAAAAAATSFGATPRGTTAATPLRANLYGSSLPVASTVRRPPPSALVPVLEDRSLPAADAVATPSRVASAAPGGGAPAATAAPAPSTTSSAAQPLPRAATDDRDGGAAAQSTVTTKPATTSTVAGAPSSPAAMRSGRRLLASVGLETSASAALTGGASSTSRPREGDTDSIALLGATHRVARSSHPPPMPSSSGFIKARKQRSEESEAALFEFDEFGACADDDLAESVPNTDEQEEEDEPEAPSEREETNSHHNDEMAIYASSLPVMIPQRWVVQEKQDPAPATQTQAVADQPNPPLADVSAASPDEETFVAPHIYSVRTTSVFEDLPRSISYRPYWNY